jgi:signal transduction histidine kinase/ActR/RegA family two-component response regulator
MNLWRKKSVLESARRGVARAASAGAPREEWLREAIHMVATSRDADRVGIWLDAAAARPGAPPGVFHGLVWDRDAEDLPPEWRQLSPEAPLPQAVLTAAGSVEIDFKASPETIILGPLLALRRALWVPVASQGRLRGMLLTGSKRRAAKLSRHLAEVVSAELALALECEEERRLAQDRQADLAVTRRMVQALGTGAVPEKALAQLVESCVQSAADQPGAVFAAIGVLGDSGPSAVPVARQAAAAGAQVAFLWSAGEQSAFETLQDGPLAGIWRSAIETRRVVGGETNAASSRSLAARAVAIPLACQDQILGVLVAGLSGAAASLATLDRLELRAALAAAFLARKQEAAENDRRIAAQRAALQASSQPALLLDFHGSVLEMSRAARSLFAEPEVFGETPPAGAPAQPLARLFRAFDHQRVAGWLRRQMPSGPRESDFPEEVLEAELASGQRVRVYPLVSAAPESAVLLLEKISPPGAAARAENAEIELRHVLEWLEEGVVLFDARGAVRAMNIRFEQMAGFSAEESGRYQTLEALIARLEPQAAEPPEFAERWRALARGMEGGVREELQMIQPIPRILERSARPILDSVGRVLGRVEIYRDLTAQRIFQSKLLQTEKLAALGQMLTGVAHELSNPLTTVLGYAQRLLARSDAYSEDAQKIHQEAERAARMLRQLLAHARETPPERGSVSLNQIVMRTVELQRFSLAAEKIHLEVDLYPLLPLVRGDAGQLQQVLMNLLGNARQAIEQQGCGGTIRVRTCLEGDDRVTLVVEDTGPGIPPAILARIFDPFFTTKPAGIGTGLGLSIVLSIVREHGGQVHVTSPPGPPGGARFSVQLPVLASPGRRGVDGPELPPFAPRESRRATPGVSLALAPAAAHATGAGADGPALLRRVLVVEDEPTVARLIADVLEDQGFAVAVLLDGREALERATHEIFDLVICDMKMPGLDGQHFFRSLARLGSPLAERFLFVTGDSIGPLTQAFLAQNNLPYLSKPFRVEELTEQVRRTLAKRGHAGARTAVAGKKK